jgi:dipeptidyl aminopeptidase/acylaminoacyl peptidase
MERRTRRFRRRGWITYTISHRPLHRAFGDVAAAYDALRRRTPGAPICAYGESSGGHLALMLAQRRSSLDCVIAASPPTDLVRWPVEARAMHDAVERLKGRVSLRRWSPARHARHIRQPVLLLHDPADAIVPFVQSADLAARLPRGALVALCPGPVRHVHTHVGAACLHRASRAEGALLRRAGQRRDAQRPSPR